MNALVRYQPRRSSLLGGCTILQIVFEEAKEILEARPYFSKSEIMKSLGWSIPTEAIDWEEIRNRFIKQDDRMDLVPLVEAFFKQHDKKLELLQTSRYIAIGRGKKTYGYGACVEKNGHLFLRYIDHKAAMANGHNKAFRDIRDAVGDKLGPDYKQDLESIDYGNQEPTDKDQSSET